MARQTWPPKLPPEAMKYATAGIEFAAVFAAFVLAGVWLDRKLGTGVVFTLVGMVIGFAGAMYRLVRLAREYRRKDDQSPRK